MDEIPLARYEIPSQARRDEWFPGALMGAGA